MQPGPQETNDHAQFQNSPTLLAQPAALGYQRVVGVRPMGPGWWQRLNAWLLRLSPKRRAGVGVGFGCATLISVCALCSCAVLAFGGGTSAGTSATHQVIASTATNSSSQPASKNALAKATATATTAHAQPTVTAQPTATAATAATATATATAAPAATATPKPKPTATPKPRPTATPQPKPTATPKPSCPNGAVNNNPWCYNFTSGSTISNPPSNFCNYFNCIKSFWENTNGYVEQCVDGMYSHSGGRSGSCSSHGGNSRPLLKP